VETRKVKGVFYAGLLICGMTEANAAKPAWAFNDDLFADAKLQSTPTNVYRRFKKSNTEY